MWINKNYWILIFIIFATISCSKKPNSSTTVKKTNNTINSSKLSEAPIYKQIQDSLKTFIFLGDSLTEGYHVSVLSNYPSLVEKQLNQSGIYMNFINAGLSGETTAGGIDRLTWYMREKPDYLFLALGSNDGLRGLSLEQTEANLEKIITDCQNLNIKIFLTGFKLPPNYGKDYTSQFEKIFFKLAKRYQLPFLPFLLEGVAGEKQLNLQDGIHPNHLGYEIISRNVSRFIKENL